MSYIDWKSVSDRQEARSSGKPWRLIQQYEANSVAGFDLVKEFYQTGIEKCSSRDDGLVCGYIRDDHERLGHQYT